MTIYSDIIAQAEQCATCDELERLAQRSLPQLQKVLADVTAAAQALAAAQELLTLNPASLADVTSYIGKLKQYVITPYLAPYQKYVAQIPQVTAGIASVTAALHSASTRIGGCDV